MAKVAVVYWSGTGNTEAMANEIIDQLTKDGAEAELFQAGDFEESMVADYDAFAFGCPAMGAEELEESEFEPMFDSVESSLEESQKPLVIFGSYEWADGEWMEKWQERCEEKNLNLVTDGLKAYDNPDDEALEACRELAKKLVESL